ncbi:hypothetical protein OIU76_018093 [Salix suchowensis]|nr:hypothetical protein OIU76_018093 [Salix suchowensis]KAJ6342132.1 hypothetical protein OIU78_010131 [Salix suchowensis]
MQPYALESLDSISGHETYDACSSWIPLSKLATSLLWSSFAFFLIDLPMLALIMYGYFCIVHIHSYQMAMEMGLRNHVARHENQYHVPQFPKEREAVLHSANFANYYHSQYLPSATTLHISSQAQGLAPSYAFPASSGAKQPLRSTYQSHYTINL